MIEFILLAILFIGGVFLGFSIMAFVSITKIVRLEAELNELRKECDCKNGK